MAAKLLMVQGTASSVGKSLLVTALCRILRQDGVRVAPFKAQNMSNNSFVTPAGGEIGRAQAAQAEAAGIEPDVAMNPILLKPESNRRSQIVLNGRPFASLEARRYFDLKQILWPHVTAALDQLCDRFDAVIIEGAGSPAEINLRSGDIVNMRVARYAGAPVVLVGDIDRGGVFAHLLGTLALIKDDERRLVRALAINKFRGDPDLLAPGLRMIEQRTGLPVAGVIPHFGDTGLADEDAVSLDGRTERINGLLDIAVIRLPYISNFDDFQPLEHEPLLHLRYVASAQHLGAPDLVILPGSKSTVADLEWLRAKGLAVAIIGAREAGSAVLGVCGGYQMLGDQIVDRDGVESRSPSVAGLGILPVVTAFGPQKTTHQVQARVQKASGLLAGLTGVEICGYEIHMGKTSVAAAGPIRIQQRSGQACSEDDGAISDDGWVLGTYVHGLFANDPLRSGVLENLARRKGVNLDRRASLSLAPDELYERLACQVRAALDMNLVYRIMERG